MLFYALLVAVFCIAFSVGEFICKYVNLDYFRR